MQLAKFFLLIMVIVPALTLPVTGCKLRTVVPVGGQVVSESGAFDCNAGQSCDIEVADLFFDEVFTAEAAQGYYFRRWQEGDSTLCADSFDPCHLSTTGFEGHAALEAILESDQTFFLRPLFAPGTCEATGHSSIDVFGNEFREQGQKCMATGGAKPVYQGIVNAYKNNVLIGVTGWDQGRRHGQARRYSEDGKLLEEVVGYRGGEYHGIQKKYDNQGRLILFARWFEGKLQGLSTIYDYSREPRATGSPIVLTSTYEEGKLDGLSRVDYPDGAWETRQYADGEQVGEYQVFVPDFGQQIAGWRTVYVFVDGLVRYGYGYRREAIEGGPDYLEKGGPEGPWLWPCVYVDGELDQDDCFRDTLKPLQPRL